MSDCGTCTHRGFREMIKKPYGYAGEIPCLTCSRFSWVKDRYSPIVAGNFQDCQESTTDVFLPRKVDYSGGIIQDKKNQDEADKFFNNTAMKRKKVCTGMAGDEKYLKYLEDGSTDENQE